MSGRIGHAEQKLNQMVARAELSPTGRDWLIAAADPFHDRVLSNLNGYPDQQVGFSITARVQQQFTIKKPADVSANWTALICTYPWTVTPETAPASGSVPLDGWSHIANVFSKTGAGAQIVWPVTCYCCDDGEDVGPFESTTSTTKYGVGLPNGYTKGPFRVVGWGYEITDTTADIYKQGTLTVYRQNTNAYEVESASICAPAAPAPQTSSGCFDFYRLRRHPKNVAEASLLAGTRVWDAEKGAYVVNVMNSSTNPAKPVNYVQPIIMQNDHQTSCYTGAAAEYVMGPAYLEGVAVTPSAVSGPAMTWGFVPYHMSGVFLTGLNEFSTYTVTVNWYIERFPSPDEESIVVLAKPSANYDPFALEFYDRMLCEMPVGVPVAENGLGEWFNGVVNQISRYVSPIARSFGGPIGNAIAMASDAAHAVSQQNLDEQKQKRKKKKQKLAQKALPPPGPGVQRKTRLTQANQAKNVRAPPRKMIQQPPPRRRP